MKNENVLNMDAMNELETLSANFEQMREFVEYLKEFAWDKVIAPNDGKEFENLGCMMTTLLDVVISRENNLEAIIKKIALVPVVAED